MLRIVTHIERLLLVHDCVIVPKFGGFVLQTIPALQDAVSHTFRPLQKEIGFNMTLQHHDGLLSESYMQLYDVNYREAQLMLEEDIEELNASLQQDRQYSLGVLGSFSLGEEGQVIYHPAETDLFSITSYGLPTFQFAALAPLQAESKEDTLPSGRKKGKKDTLYIPISRKLLRTAVGLAGAIALFLLISTPVTDVNQAAYTASFVPAEMVAHRAVASVVQVAEAEMDGVAVRKEFPVVVAADPVAVEQPAVPKQDTVKSRELTSEAVIVQEIKKSNAKMYHIVIASFPSEKQADEYMAGVDNKECKHVSKVVRDGKYRIYADRFDNRQDAESYMATLRSNPKYKDAWLFISR